MRLLWHFRFVMICFLLPGACSMFTKRSGPNREGEPQSKRFRANVEDLFLSNELAANRVQSLVQDASFCGDPFHVARLASAGKGGALPKNIARDFMRKTKKRRGKDWPPLYEFSVRLWDTKKGEETVGKICMLLPHELISSLVKKDNHQALLAKTNLCSATQQHMHKVAHELAIPEAELIAVALWGDGVPFNWDRKESLEAFTMCFPGLAGEGAKLRIPLTGLSKRHCSSRNTYDDLFTVFACSSALGYRVPSNCQARWQ